MNLIGIAGRMHSGKSTLAEYMVGQIKSAGGEADTEYFSRTIKKTLNDIASFEYECAAPETFSLSGFFEYLNSDRFKSKKFSSGISVRKACQILGDTLRRIEPLALINCMNKWLFNVPDNYTIIIPDVRKIGEVSYIHEKGGKVIYLDRHINDGQHNTESELDGQLDMFDFVINNQNMTISEKNSVAKEWLIMNKYITGGAK